MDEQFIKKRATSYTDSRTAWEQTTTNDHTDVGSAIDYIKQVYALLAGSLLLAVAAGYVGMSSNLIANNPLLFIGGQIGLVVLAFFVRNTVTLFLFTGLSGFFTGPIIGYYVNAGMSTVVGQAFFLTGTIFSGLTVYAFTTRRDLSGLGNLLFVGLMIIMVGGLANLFLRLPALSFAISAMGALIFSGYILWDTQRLKQQPWQITPAVAALGMYLNILNLFLDLLQLLGIFSRED